MLASGDCASYATLPGAVLPCHNSSSWLQLAWVDQCLRRADGDAGRSYEYFARVRPDYFFARPLPAAHLRREAAAGAVLTDCCQKKAGGDQFLFRGRSTTAGGARVRNVLGGATFDRRCPENFLFGLSAAAPHARVAQAFGVYAGIARTATDVWVRMNATPGSAAAASAGAASDAASAHEEQRRRGAVRAAYAAFANARDAERCAAASEAMRNGSIGADAVARRSEGAETSA